MSSNHAVTIITFLCPPCSFAVLGLLWMFLSVLHLMEAANPDFTQQTEPKY